MDNGQNWGESSIVARMRHKFHEISIILRKVGIFYVTPFLGYGSKV